MLLQFITIACGLKTVSTSHDLYIDIYIVRGDSVVGIKTRHGLDDTVIESRRGRDFPYLSRPALGPT